MIDLEIVRGKKNRIICGVKFVNGKASLPDGFLKRALMICRFYAVEGVLEGIPIIRTKAEVIEKVEDDDPEGDDLEDDEPEGDEPEGDEPEGDDSEGHGIKANVSAFGG